MFDYRGSLVAIVQIDSDKFCVYLSHGPKNPKGDRIQIPITFDLRIRYCTYHVMDCFDNDQIIAENHTYSYNFLQEMACIFEMSDLSYLLPKITRALCTMLALSRKYRLLLLTLLKFCD